MTTEDTGRGLKNPSSLSFRGVPAGREGEECRPDQIRVSKARFLSVG